MAPSSVASRNGAARRRFGPLLRLLAAVTVLLLLGRQLGAAPFRDGLRSVTGPALLAAAVLTAVATVCSAWRWQVVARAFGLDIGLPAAVGAYYRSQFLNLVLPGAVLGDVHRGLTHGRRTGEVGRGLRAVAWERLSGQTVQAAVTAVVLLTMPSPVRAVMPYLLLGAAGIVVGAAFTLRRVARRRFSRLAVVARSVEMDLRQRLLTAAVWPRLIIASVLVVAGHTTTFVVAARAAGCQAPLGELVALLMLVQTAVAIPLSIGGWGPREGAAAWAFAAAGLGAAAGVTMTTLYAVLAMAAVAPAAGLLARDAVRRIGRNDEPRAADSSHPGPVPASPEANLV